MKLAVAKEWREDDPTIGVELPQIRGKGHRTWTDEEAAKFEAAHLQGSRARLAYELFACTALRRGDIVRVGRQHVRPRKKIASIGPYKVTHDLVLPDQHKTGEPLELPILPWLQAAIDALPADNLTFLVTPQGKPLSAKRLGAFFHESCIAAGLTPEICDESGKAKGLSGHGLRKRMAKRLAENGCSELRIAAVLGHRDLRQVRTYTAAANKKRMADDAMFKLLEAEQPRTADLQTEGTDLQTAVQAIDENRN